MSGFIMGQNWKHRYIPKAFKDIMKNKKSRVD